MKNVSYREAVGSLMYVRSDRDETRLIIYLFIGGTFEAPRPPSIFNYLIFAIYIHDNPYLLDPIPSPSFSIFGAHVAAQDNYPILSSWMHST